MEKRTRANIFNTPGRRKQYAQSEFLKRRAIAAKETETCCDCPGCNTCKGFVRNCTCDHDLGALHEARQTRTGLQPERPGIQLATPEDPTGQDSTLDRQSEEA